MIKPFFALPIAFLLVVAPLGAQTNPLATSTPLQTGFVVITPTSGGGSALSASETIGNLQSSGFQTAVIPAQLPAMNASVAINLSNSLSPLISPLFGTTQVSTDASNIAGNHPGYSPGILGGRTGLPIQQNDLNPPSQSNIGTNTSATTSSSSLTPQAITVANGETATLFSNTAVAIVNPNQSAAAIVVTLNVGTGPIRLPDLTIGPMQQASEFVDQLLGSTAALFTLPVTGLLSFNSNVPISVAALQFRGSSFTALPVTTASPSAGNGTLVLPQFLMGGGWATQITIANVSNSPQTVRIDIFSSNDAPLSTTLNGQTGSTFDNVQVPAGNVINFGPQDAHGQNIFQG